MAKSLAFHRASYSLLSSASVFLTLLVFLTPSAAQAGTLLLSPAGGAHTVGDTFEVKVLLDTRGQSVNALDVELRFPPDKLQLVSPKTNVSVIALWTSQPEFNNQTGTIRLQGGIPGGINVSNALVATFTFRVKAIGNAIVRFADRSKVLLNDGLGTNDLSHRVDGLYTLTLPPPAGPDVTSPTHPLQTEWYADSNVSLTWTSEGSQNFSYIFNEEAVSGLDDIGDGERYEIAYTGVPDGRHYFHIKALRNGAWGGRTDFAVNVDTTSPADFPLEVLPGRRTNITNPVIKFATTDTLSGIDHYEIKVVPLSPIFVAEAAVKGDTPFFVEASSPYILPDLSRGRYDMIVRAYDKAGNYRDETERLTIASGFLGLSMQDGLSIGPLNIPWKWSLSSLAIVLVCLLYLRRVVRNIHRRTNGAREDAKLPSSVQTQLDELKRLKSKYGIVAMLCLCVLGASAFGLGAPRAYALGEEMTAVELAPPYITTISRDVSSSEIFYIGGKTENKNTAVTIYSQNTSSGETASYAVKSDTKGDWFYRHNGFLSPGTYMLWVQARVGNIESPPSPQVELHVARTAIIFGASRISYEVLLLGVMLVLSLVIVYLIAHIMYHARGQKKKKVLVMREIHEAEESLKRGFAILRKDIEREVEMIRQIGLVRPMDESERRREQELISDLKDVERRIGKEIWDVERSEAA